MTRSKPDAGNTFEQKLAEAVGAYLEPMLGRLIKTTVAEAAAAMTPPPAAPIPQDDGFDPFVPIRDACKLVGAHKTTLLRLEHQGILPPRRMLGGRSGWLRSELQAALNRTPGTPAAR